MVEVRIDPSDGLMYSKADFLAAYGAESGLAQWAAAEPSVPTYGVQQPPPPASAEGGEGDGHAEGNPEAGTVLFSHGSFHGDGQGGDQGEEGAPPVALELSKEWEARFRATAIKRKQREL